MITRTLAAFLISVGLIGCSSLNRADSERMLAYRAGYEPDMEISNQSTRKERIYMYPHRISNGDWFSGGWIVTEFPNSQWLRVQSN